tara:strand:- start:4955 stop:5131 length:177 start_codon:yes stop_codon:yes gene_type:complete
MKTTETTYLENCLASLKGFSKDQLLDEFEQLLLCMTDKKESLKGLSDFYKKGGLKQKL